VIDPFAFSDAEVSQICLATGYESSVLGIFLLACGG
jgi:hypothetical protein